MKSRPKFASMDITQPTQDHPRTTAPTEAFLSRTD